MLLDLKSQKKVDERDKYATFFYFDKLGKEKDLNEVWREVVQTFLTLKDWYQNHELYHKIGYLIASGYKNLADIFTASQRKTKRQFREKLDEFIKNSVALKGVESYSEWTYEKDRTEIQRLLLLFNVESVRKNGEKSQWFPFDKFKFGAGGKTSWSLEHINAVNSPNKGVQADWREWLKLYLNAVQAVAPDLVKDVEKLLKLSEIRAC